MATVCRECGGTGGRFRWVGDGQYVHTPSCDRAQPTRDGAKNLWNFTTKHLDPNNPVHVTSAAHMSRLEKEYGVSSRVLNYNEQNW
jgi:hypothetical protein